MDIVMPPFERELLEMGIEDFTPFSWVVGVVRRTDAAADAASARIRAVETLRSLAKKGWIQLYRGQQFAGEETLLGFEQVEEALGEEPSWNPNVSVTTLTTEFVTTAKGKAALSGFSG